MSRWILKIIAFVATSGLIAGLTGCQKERLAPEPYASTNSKTTNFDYDLDDKIVQVATTVKFDISNPSVQKEDLLHRWYFNGFIIDSTNAAYLNVANYNSASLTLNSVSLTNCGFYRYENENTNKADFPRMRSRTAQLLIVSNAPIMREMVQPVTVVVYGTPIAGHGGDGGCPGKYVGYVEYDNGGLGWHLSNINVNGMAYDASGSSDTEVYYIGVPSANWGCGTNIPKLAHDYPYRFRIYFKTTALSGPYPITLVGFKP